VLIGSQETRRYYDQTKWKEEDGISVDHHLFGVKEDGPIRIQLHSVHQDRILAVLSDAGTDLNLLDCGCGGNPDRHLLDLCSRYTGVDFSITRIQMARFSFADVQIPHEFHAADVCALPFRDGTFDAVYCAHMIYQIEDPRAQQAAIAEFVRVIRPGGVVVLNTANPRPLAFPMRLARRLAADSPLARPILNRVRSKPLLPYKPMTIGWMRRQLAAGGSVQVLTADIPSTSFYQKVTEFKGTGRFLWKGIRWLDVNHPKISAYLGNYVLLSSRKAAAGSLHDEPKSVRAREQAAGHSRRDP
jgi:ubiquinone/menaquinone biosynthesis C-methylase UbiE